MEEIWKNINSKYQVSNLGRVRSLQYGKVKQLSLCKNSDGYLVVSLWDKMKRKQYLVHRLVAEAFIPNPNNYPQINHINEDKTDNSVTNLEWCDCKYNVNYGTHNQRMFDNMPKHCVVKYDLEGNYIAEYQSIKMAARENNISSSNIGQCCNGKRKTAGKCIWKYKE